MHGAEHPDTLTTANNLASTLHSMGQYNEADRVGTLFVVGNGESDAARSNAFEVSSDGALVNGDLEVGGVLSIDGANFLQIIAGLQAQIDALQAEVDALSGGE